MSSETTSPVRVLHEHTVALEAALTVCLAEATGRAVHRLRTETRRVEAQLFLLSTLPDLPPHKREAKAFKRSLKGIRRAAGDVRDYDVQRKTLQSMAKTLPERGTAQVTVGNAVSRSKNEDAVATGLAGRTPEDTRKAAKGAADLRNHLGVRRKKAAKGLRALLGRGQSKVATQAETMLKMLAEAEGVTLRKEELLDRALRSLQRDGLLAQNLNRTLTADELHSIRKGAKAARYLAETMPDSRMGKQAAKRFEALQQVGGDWHDSLELARESRKFLGRHHQLTLALVRTRDLHLQLYREALEVEARLHESGTKQRAAVHDTMGQEPAGDQRD